jgi:hypothetical protein
MNEQVMGIEINYCSVTEVVDSTFRVGCGANRAGEVGACHNAFEFTPRSPLAKAPVHALPHQLRGVELPFLILCVNSIPLIATTALSNRFNPSIG